MAAPTVRGFSAVTKSTDAVPAVAITLPTRVAGDLLLCFVGVDAATNCTPTGTWAELRDTPGASNNLAVYSRIATNDANDNLSVAAANTQDLCAVIMAVTTGTHGVASGSMATDIKIATNAAGTSAAADPPSLDGGSVKDWRAIAFAVVDLTATGSVISAAPTNYTTGAILDKSAASTSSVAIGVGHRALTAAQTEDPGAFTNTSGAWITTTILVPPPAPSQGAATGSIDWVGSATGTRTSSGAASGSVAWVGSATGSSVHSGVAAGAVAWAGSATGEMPVVPPEEGTATGAVDWAGAATGTNVRSGSTSGAIAWAGAATGAATHTGASSGDIAWVGSATGATTHQGTVSGSMAWVGEATGDAPSGASEGAATGTITWAGTAIGSAPYKGAVTGTIVWTGVSATGQMPEPVDEGDTSVPDEVRILPVNERRTLRVPAENRTMEVPAP